MGVNAMEETYEPVELLGKPALFTNARIDRDTIPSGLFACDIREGDGGRAATAEKTVTVNHMGTVILAEPLDFGDNGYIDLTDENGGLNFAAEHDNTTVLQFQVYIGELRERAAGEVARHTVYLHPASYAREHDELPLFRQSTHQNRECRRAIDDAVTENWRGSNLNPACVKTVFEQFGEQRVNIVLANTVCEMDYDARFSRVNRDWAKSQPQVYGDGFILKSHPVKLDCFIDQVRGAALERGVGQRTPTLAEQLAEAKKQVQPPSADAPGKKRDMGRG